MRRRHDIARAEERVLLRRLDRKDVDRGAGDLAASSAASKSSSTIRPPRAQLMMRTPVFILASAFASMMRASLGQRRVQGDEIGAREELVELDPLDAEGDGALGGEERVVSRSPSS